MTAVQPGADALRALIPGLARTDPPGVAALLSPFMDWLRGPGPGAAVRETVDAVSAASRALYEHARSPEALPLARELLAHCLRAEDRAQVRRAAGICGLLAADSADLVGAIEYHVRALRLAAADEDRGEMARAWTNVGHALGVAGRYELSSRCFRRALGLLEPVAQPLRTRHVALVNLADAHFHLGEVAEGIVRGEAALRELAGIADTDPYGTMLLRRTLVRLLIAAGRPADAADHLAGMIALAEAHPSPRAAIAVDIARGAFEMSTGNADLALTRFDRALDRAREVPAALHDALAGAVRAEEAAGNVARALMRLEELSNHVFSHGIERARRIVEAAGVDPSEPVAEHGREQARARLVSRLDPPAPPREWAALRRLAAGAVLRMDDSGWHGVRVGALVKGLALAWGCPPLQSQELGLAAELHDAGMASVPAAILAKRGPLNDAERATVRKHPEAGAAMLIDDRHPRVLLARDIARYHHARWDGAGYPERVAGGAIPLGARMCAIADAYDMMVCGFGGRAPRSMADALAELQREAGGQFDPKLVSCFHVLIRDRIDGRDADASEAPGMEAFQALIAALKENRGFA